MFLEGFKREEVEKLHKEKGEATTLADIEAIVGTLRFNEEEKDQDAEGDLVTLVRTFAPNGDEIVNYHRRTHKGEDDQYKFTIVVNKKEDL